MFKKKCPYADLDMFLCYPVENCKSCMIKQGQLEKKNKEYYRTNIDCGARKINDYCARGCETCKKRFDLRDKSLDLINQVGSSIHIPGIEGKGDLSKKPHHAGIDAYFIKEMAKVMRFGANKHGKNNFRKMTQEAAQEIRDSVSRHWNDGFLCGQELDEETGLTHLAHAACNLSFLYRICRKYGYKEVLKVINGGEDV